MTAARCPPALLVISHPSAPLLCYGLIGDMMLSLQQSFKRFGTRQKMNPGAPLSAAAGTLFLVLYFLHAVRLRAESLLMCLFPGTRGNLHAVPYTKLVLVVTCKPCSQSQHRSACRLLQGANQAVAAARLSQGGHLPPVTRFVCKFGNDSYAAMLQQQLAAAGVDVTGCGRVAGLASGQGVVLLEPDGTASSVVLGGSNTAWREVRRGTLVAMFHNLLNRGKSRGAGGVWPCTAGSSTLNSRLIVVKQLM
jgi:hypothetical protein